MTEPDSRREVREEQIREALRPKQRVAILGASLKPGRAGYYVSRYLHQHGFTIFPVNPTYAGQALEGRPFVARLSELEEPVDILTLFRRGQALPRHLPEIAAMTPPPRVAWFQPGSHNAAVEAAVEAAGIDVVRDRCMLAEHQRLG